MTLINRRKHQLALKKQRLEKFSKSLQKKKARHAEYFVRAEKYVQLYKENEKNEIRLKQEAKKEGSLIVPGEGRLALVIRIRGYV